MNMMGKPQSKRANKMQRCMIGTKEGGNVGQIAPASIILRQCTTSTAFQARPNPDMRELSKNVSEQTSPE